MPTRRTSSGMLANEYLGRWKPEEEPENSERVHPRERIFKGAWYAYAECPKLKGYQDQDITIEVLRNWGGRMLLIAKDGPQGLVSYHFTFDKMRVDIDRLEQGWTAEGIFWVACPMVEPWIPKEGEMPIA